MIYPCHSRGCNFWKTICLNKKKKQKEDDPRDFDNLLLVDRLGFKNS